MYGKCVYAETSADFVVTHPRRPPMHVLRVVLNIEFGGYIYLTIWAGAPHPLQGAAQEWVWRCSFHVPRTLQYVPPIHVI